MFFNGRSRFPDTKRTTLLDLYLPNGEAIYSTANLFVFTIGDPVLFSHLGYFAWPILNLLSNY